MKGTARSVLIGTLTLVFGLTIGGIARAASVTPEHVDGASNRTCSEFAGSGQTWSEFKIDPPANGTFDVNGGTITVSNLTPTSFDWSSSFGIDAVYVKSGSNGSNLYRYDPPAESTGDTDLETPAGDPQQAISHISFCWDADTVASPTPTPAVSPTQASRPPRVLGEQLLRNLPATGVPSPAVPASGAAAIVLGFAFVALAHRRERSALLAAREATARDWAERLDRYLSL